MAARLGTPAAIALPAALSRDELEALLVRAPELGTPSDDDLGLLEPVAGQSDDPGAPFALVPHFRLTVELRTLLDELREREHHLDTTGHLAYVTPRYIEVVTVDGDGNLERHIGTVVGESQNSVLAIPLDAPLSEVVLSTASRLEQADRVRFLGEMVRRYRHAIGFYGLGDGGLCVSVRLGRQLVGLLRAAISDASNDPAPSTDQDRGPDSHPRRDVSGIHPSIVATQDSGAS